MVNIQLQNLVLAESALDLQGQQRLVELPLKGLFAPQKEIPRHLHGDRARALHLAAAREVYPGSAQDTGVIDAAMLIKAVVFGGQDCLTQLLRHGVDFYRGAPLFAELANQHIIGGVYAQRYSRLIVGQRIEGRQTRKDQDHSKQCGHTHNHPEAR